ncbi:unnamed protein product [Bursaphelenchus xylophilus]|uniref:(pine wood nematode) hypothetical protein n=1 Tax=Bursaphelenchus xylophilus TaxID=6326 RepID=A0A1I7RJL0_BURXY|nr:unnamed protein product [Bursaphelenchus xylophilus]CAG9128936.1 unnamed protein product [Bursaphelenchus xylophilus]
MDAPFVLPEKYQFLLGAKEINDDLIASNKRLFRHLTRPPTKLRHYVKRNMAALCLNFAHDYIESETPIFLNAVVGQVRQYQVGAKKERSKYDAIILLPADLYSPDFINVAVSDFVRIERDGEVVLSGRVYRVSPSEIRIKGDVNPTNKVPKKNSKVNLYKQLIDFVPKAIVTAMQRIQSGAFNHIVMPEADVGSEESFNSRWRGRLLKFASENTELQMLNLEQQLAVYVICKELHKPWPFILFGPPGTGKTVTIVATIRQLIKSENNRILICTPSNTAADRVAKELMKYLDKDGPGINRSEDEKNEETGLNRWNVLRFVSPSVDFEKRDKSLDPISNVISDGYDVTLDVAEYKVIICTLATSSRLCGDQFTHIFVDEAGQACECEIWIPIGCCATRKTSLILCGDPNQLGPVNMLNLSEIYTGYLESPLKRYLRIPEYKNERMFCIQLTKCFRCHGEIVKIASDLFYDGSLENAGDQEWKNELCNHKYWLNKGFPMLFIDVPNQEHEYDPHSASLANPAEAKVVYRMVRHLLRMKIDPEKIGIVSPYKYHSKIIRERLAEKFGDGLLDKLTVDSVERFQGNEREVIIMTTARTEGKGFLFCNLRLNTAITRAQRLLIVIGSRKVLKKHDEWAELIDFIKDHKGYLSSSPFNRVAIDRNGSNKTPRTHWALMPVIITAESPKREEENETETLALPEKRELKTEVSPKKATIRTRPSTVKRKNTNM